MEHEVLGQSVIVKQDDAADRTEGGLYLPDESKVKPLRGKLIKTGDECKRICNADVGKAIIFDRFAGVLVELDGEEFLVMDEEDILIVLKRSQ